MLGTVLVFACLAVLCAVSVANGTYFDDEIFSIRLIERGGSLEGIRALANAGDVHPPLGYMFDYALRELLGGYPAVKLAKGLFAALALAFLAFRSASALPIPAWAILCALLATDATTIMWASSLRCYGWFAPIFALALAAIAFGATRPIAGAAILAAAGLVLFHVGYLAVIAVPLLGIVWLIRMRGKWTKNSAVASGAILGVAVLACVLQLLVLLEVHMAYTGPQTGPVWRALAQSGTTALLGDALFPLGILPIAALATTGLAIAHYFWRGRLEHQGLWLLLALGIVVMSLTGLGYRHRNNLFLHIAALVPLALALAALPLRPRIVALLVVGTASLVGVANVANHNGTAKRSFNAPYASMVEQLKLDASDCRKSYLQTLDPVAGFLLQGSVQQIPLFGGRTRIEAGQCLFVVTGSAIPLDLARSRAWERDLSRLPARLEIQHNYAEEPARVAAAELLGEALPTHALIVRKYKMANSAQAPTLPY